ncbi:LOW QUALITY PROTEIN: protein NYNRIN-like [Perognathus longimembris pacificus]|uniref:LOW QUALITY PROTEIN: protein NYNRIN-like n=1 Tax=Perognathus longimembris pacificus TaxID=214514 RepID=UPI002019ABEC|nr:LOW QUALITY PROTEIN: protein NYNRIN-like [Perognathus longimembris pacificus]
MWQMGLCPPQCGCKDPKAKAPKVLPPGDDLLLDLMTEDSRLPQPPPYPAETGSREDVQRPDPSPIATRTRVRRDDLYNWKNNNPPFSKDPAMLTALIESILVTHQPTWDDCQQLLQVLLTTEERQRVLLEARKNVRGADGRPTQLPNEINAAFPLERPDWDFTTVEVDTGAQHSVLNRDPGPLSDKSAWVQGATGGRRYRWTTDRRVHLATGKVTHSFLHVPDCPYPLLGRDLLQKLRAQIHFEESGVRVVGPKDQPLQVLTLSLEEEYRLYENNKRKELPLNLEWLNDFPQAWAETGGMGLARRQAPLVIALRANTTPVSIKQYPMSQEARIGIKPHIKRLLDQGILKPCQSPWNTPLLPVKKPGTGDYRPVQDLREVNKRVEDIHPTVPNPYNLLSGLSPAYCWYTVLDLKDAFFCLRLHPDSQPIFAFEWKDPELGISGQLTWTRLPQGFKNSPTLFDEALHRDLADFRVQHPALMLLQYVDDLLLAATSERECREGTRDLLHALGTLGYRASAKKAQICQQQVTYLGYLIKKGERWLTDARKETVMNIPEPQNSRQLREFLGTAGFCRLWIPGFAEMASPLYPLTKQGTMFAWGEEQQKAFQNIKKALLTAPALGLPDLTKPFDLYVAESKGHAKGVLTQKLGPWRRPVAYLSKKLDPVASGWPPCLRMVAAIAVLVKDASKLTFGQSLTILAPHAVEALIRQPPDRWLSNARMTHYQTMLLDTDRVRFGPVMTINPATLLPSADEEAVPHDCLEILAEVHGTRSDLTDQPLQGADFTWYTDGSSLVLNGERKAGAAVTTETEVIWAETLPPGTSAQRAELIALTQALKMASGKRLNVYTDSRYAFATAHIHGEIYSRRGLLTSEGKEVKNKREILALLHALFLPRKLSIMHCPGHQKGDSPIARGNRMADETARRAAVISVPPYPVSNKEARAQWLEWQSASIEPEGQTKPIAMCLQSNAGQKGADLGPFVYPKKDEELLTNLGARKDDKRKIWILDNKTVLPRNFAQQVIEQVHQLTHLSPRKIKALLDRDERFVYFLGKEDILQRIYDRCRACAMVNAGKTKSGLGNVRMRGHRPGVHWEVDFTEIKPGLYGYQYLLVFVDTFSGWVEAFPTKQETAKVVSKKLLEEIFPRYGMPKFLGSDNGPAFVSQVNQQVAMLLGINWKLHCSYRPQSSGQVERMNRTIKETLTKLTLAAGSKDWVLLLPLALYRARNTPGPHGLTPFEILYGAPPPCVSFYSSDVSTFANSQNLQAHLQALQTVQREVWEPLAAAYKEQLERPVVPHQFQIGDSVWVRRHQTKNLEPRWKGPYTVLLTTPTALKVDGIAAWIHASHVKPASAEETIPEWRVQRTQNPLKIRLIKGGPSS